MSFDVTDAMGLSKDPARASTRPEPRKLVKVPRVVSWTVQRQLMAALARAEAAGDKDRADHVRQILNGTRPLPGGRP